jgi:FMN-dependent NADH-azoreductase
MTNNSNNRTLEILRIDSSARYSNYVSRELTDHMIARLLREYPDAKITTRDLAAGIPLPSEAFVDGSLYAMENPTPVMQESIKLSNEMVTELLSADIVVLGLPVYNWTIPSTFKAYVDHISRLGVTFTYVDGVRQGLLGAHSIYILFTSGGTGIGTENDFATPYVTYLWQTLGIQNIQLVDASGLLFNTEEIRRNALTHIDALVLPVTS